VYGKKLKNKLKTWLRALDLAKILFQDQAYHTRFLEEIEDKLRMIEGEMIQLHLPFPKKRGRRKQWKRESEIILSGPISSLEQIQKFSKPGSQVNLTDAKKMHMINSLGGLLKGL
jgi:hypothetical protein